jgi:cytoskeletal protein RodZ
MNFRFFAILSLITILILTGIFSWTAYGYYQAVHADDPITPMLSIEEGQGKIIRGDLAIELDTHETYEIERKDIIETAPSSKATIIWPDRSITRLGAQTRIIIDTIIVTDDYQDIRISYKIEKGKVWNTIIRMLLGDSYFETHLPKRNIVA